MNVLGRGSVEELQGLLAEHWAEVYRAGRKIQRHGPLTVSAFSGAIAHELSLGPRDFPVLHTILSACVLPGGDEVDVPKLKAAVAEADRIADGNTEWQVRCGLVKARPGSERAVSAGARRKYAIENHGSPFAIAGDAKATLRLQQDERRVREERIRNAVTNAARGGRLTRAALSGVVAGHLDVSEAELEDLLHALDPRRSNAISAELFLAQFLAELMKPKSLRRSVLPAIAPPATEDGGAGEAPAGLSSRPRKALRSASPRQQYSTRAAKLRQSLGVSLRKFNEADGISKDWITQRSTSPRKATARSSPRGEERHHATQVGEAAHPIPHAPSRGRSPASARYRRVKSAVEHDAVKLGNVPAPS